MKSNYLLSNKFKLPGWILLIVGLITGTGFILSNLETDMLTMKVLAIIGGGDSVLVGSSVESSSDFFQIIENSIVDELITIAIIVGGFFVGFSKEKVEDEFIYKLRNDSLVWAVIFNYIILLLTVIFVYNFSFFNVLVYNMFTPLLFFIMRFNVLKLKANHEE
ncbi:MAG: hypothetical protein GYB32_07620 [Algicola sp.]|nr:hypothetical protein [Algicola sp.]